MFSIIAATGKNHELGKSGHLLFHIKDDLRFFRNTTMGHPILMGRKTWESLPGKLPGRKNIVVSRHPVVSADQSVSDLPAFIAKYADSPEEIFVIGGGMLYATLLPYAHVLYLTEIAATDPAADTFFPQFDKSKYHKKLIKKGTENGLGYSIVKYIRHDK